MKITIKIEKYHHPLALPGLDTKVTVMTKRGGVSCTCHGKDEALALAAGWLTHLYDYMQPLCEECGS